MRARIAKYGRAAVVASAFLCLAAVQRPAAEPGVPLGPPRQVAPGVDLYHVTDPARVDPPAPVSIWLLRLDPRSADLRAVLANDQIVDTETVPDIGARYRAVAAVNAGFFLLPSGDPSGIYKLNGQLISDTRRPRGALGIVREADRLQLIFGRVSATMSLRILRRARPDARMEISGVDTTRRLGALTLFTSAYHAHTDTAPGGLEWVVEGRPLRVAGPPRSSGRTPIPRQGFVLSYGGNRAPVPLTLLRPGTAIALETRYSPIDGTAQEWARAQDIVGGAGLLVREGHAVTDWTIEQFAAGFAESRHPRTMIGTRPDGSIWLVTVDGRQPQLSAGMTLVELRAFAQAIGLTNAVNLDGGGSTTMWVRGEILNSPSDAAGPRKVSDALLVMSR